MSVIWHLCLEMLCVVDFVGILASLAFCWQTGNESDLIYQGGDSFQISLVLVSVKSVMFYLTFVSY